MNISRVSFRHRLIYSYLRANYYASEKYRLWPLEACGLPVKDDTGDGIYSQMDVRKLSPILKGYLRTGAMICGAPVYDEEFGTADVLALLEMEKMTRRYKQHYFGAAQGF
jgi:hypothetical protein